MSKAEDYVRRNPRLTFGEKATVAYEALSLQPITAYKTRKNFKNANTLKARGSTGYAKAVAEDAADALTAKKKAARDRLLRPIRSARYRMTAARKAALKKAQRASARVRKKLRG